MTRTLTDLFQVNGKHMLAPDEDMEMSYEDIDSADSGRGEDGVMHRIVVRYGVGKWSFTYSAITDEDYQYMESLFPSEGTFEFAHPSRSNASNIERSTCYRSKSSLSWHNARKGMWRNYKFNIIEC